MKAIILNYWERIVNVAEIPADVERTPEAVDDYLSLELGFHIDDISYMICDDDKVEVYACGGDLTKDKPIAII